jgi:putative ABC transport system permease protein
MPISYAEAIRGTPGVQDVTWVNWFGGVYKDPTNFFAQYAIEPESYLRMYPELVLRPEEKQAFLEDRTGCIVGDGLARSYGFKLGDTITLKVGIPNYGIRDFDFTVRGIYRSGGATVDNQSMMFHWKYADERSTQKGLAGWYIAQIADPDQAAQVAGAIDRTFANSPFETKTDTEKAFQSTFVSMFGNINLLLGSIALAVVITTLFVAGNTMAMSVRERTTEIAVMRTLGFQAATIFLLIAGEALLMSIGGGLAGALLARVVVNPTFFPTGGFIPAIAVNNANVATGVGLSAVIGLLAGAIPATMAARLRIVDALRRVA